MSDSSENAPVTTTEESEDSGAQPKSLFSRIFGSPDAEAVADNPSQIEVASADAGAREMLVNLRNLRDMRVEDVYVPKADIAAISDEATLPELVEAFRKSGMTRLPVFTETLDTPVGFIHLKDLALNFGFGNSDKPFKIESLIRKLLFVPPSMRIGVLLQKMQGSRIHLALVIDEYGGVEGLISIEDLLEQIVGDIADEHDDHESALWIEERPGVYLAYARADLEEFEAMAKVDLLPDDVDEDVDTLGGLVFRLAGRVPGRGEIVPHPDGHEIEVIDADPRKVKRMRLRLKRPTGQDDGSD
jgi:magnesium and cobalt transporter